MTTRAGGFLLRGGGGQDGRDQVGEALADARARLDHQVPAAVDGGRHRLGHGQLLAAGLVIRQPGGNAAPGPRISDAKSIRLNDLARCCEVWVCATASQKQ